MTFSDEEKPRFKKIIEEANCILLSTESIQSFPFSVKKVVKEKFNIVCRSFEKGAMYGFNAFDFGSKDAILQKWNDRYIIFYNESNQVTKKRKVFSVGHEFGHFIMDHKLGDKEKYGLYEIEANFFAAQLLMPEQVINELCRRGLEITKSNLQKWFGVSGEAAQKRMDTLRKVDYSNCTDYEKEMNNYIVKKFASFIDSIAPSPNLFNDFDPYEEEELQKERDSWY